MVTMAGLASIHSTNIDTTAIVSFQWEIIVGIYNGVQILSYTNTRNQEL